MSCVFKAIMVPNMVDLGNALAKTFVFTDCTERWEFGEARTDAEYGQTQGTEKPDGYQSYHVYGQGVNFGLWTTACQCIWEYIFWASL